MPSIRELRSRINSVKSTKKITKAQELIATSRITKAQNRVIGARPYVTELSRTLSQLASSNTSVNHVLIKERPDVKRSGVVVISSDRGMCGGYNHNIFRETKALIKLLEEQGKEPVLFVLGRKGIEHFNFKEQKLAGAWSGFSQDPHPNNVREALDHFAALLRAGSDQKIAKAASSTNPVPDIIIEGDQIAGIDELYIVYTKFISMMVQKPEARRLAPVDVDVLEVELEQPDDFFDANSKKASAETSFEPEPEKLLELILSKYLGARIFASLLESAAAESAARRTAMKAATDNANELQKVLSRQANLARQAQITSEISEIVGASAALQG